MQGKKENWRKKGLTGEPFSRFCSWLAGRPERATQFASEADKKAHDERGRESPGRKKEDEDIRQQRTVLQRIKEKKLSRERALPKRGTKKREKSAEHILRASKDS